MKLLGRLTGRLLMLVGGFCILIGVVGFFWSLLALLANGLTLVIMGGVVFGLGVWIDLTVQLLDIQRKTSENLDNIASVARLIARRENASKGGPDEALNGVAVYDAGSGERLRNN